MVEDDGAGSTQRAEETDVPFAERRLSAARVSDKLLIPETGSRTGRAQRHDGWTPERVRTFLTTLAECGVVADAARAAGMSVRNAYRLRNRADGGAFNVAWIAAQLRARRRLGDTVLSRALHGCVEMIMKDGEVVAEKHRFDNRLTMAVLDRLDRLADAGDDESRAARFVAQEFDQFVDLVCAGGDGAARFIASRDLADDVVSRNDTARNLARLESYRRHGEGLSEEVAARAAAAPSDAGESADGTVEPAGGEAPEVPAAAPEADAPQVIVNWLPPT